MADTNTYRQSVPYLVHDNGDGTYSATTYLVGSDVSLGSGGGGGAVTVTSGFVALTDSSAAIGKLAAGNAAIGSVTVSSGTVALSAGVAEIGKLAAGTAAIGSVIVAAFSPTGSVAVSASTVSAQKTLPVTGDFVWVQNASGDYAFVLLGSGVLTSTAPTGTAGVSGVPVASGQSMMFDCPSSITAIAVILNSGTGTVYATRGYGSSH